MQKLFLTFCESHRGFAREPKRAQLAPTLQTPPKFHEKTHSERQKKNEMGAGEGKKSEILGGPAEGGYRGGAPKGGGSKGAGPNLEKVGS